MTFGWSYPAGVTGRELPIAGPDWEGVLAVDCENEDATLTCVSQDVVKLFDELLRRGAWESFVTGRLYRTLRAQPPLQVEVMCPFTGKVDAWSHGGVTYWECPVCGFHHADEDEGEDPDAAYDRMRDERAEEEYDR
jgi:Zn ribbon nucleic-acid-binding protein